MEVARNELAAMNLEDDALSSSSSPESGTPATPGSPSSPLSPVTPVTLVDAPAVDSFVFAFDIDGVLIRGGRPIPEAIEAMKVLNGQNEYGVKV